MTVFNTLPPGIVVPFGGSSAPPGWLLCDGSPISRTVYQNLFLSIGTVWGNGDGSTTFHLPDLRGRFLRGKDGGIGRDPDRTTRTAANPGGNTGDNVGSVQDNAHGHNHANTISATSDIPSVNHTHGNTGWISHNHGHYIYGNNDHTHSRSDAHFSSPPNASMYGTNQTYDADNGRYTHIQVSDATGNHEHWTGGIDTNHQHNSGGRSADHTHVATASVTINNNGTTTETRPLNANVNYIIKI